MPINGLSTNDEINSYEKNGKARYAFLSGLSNTKLVKAMNLETTNEI